MKNLGRLWPLAVILVACLYALLSFDWRLVGNALRGVELLSLLIKMAVVTLVVFLVCALRWIAINGLPWRWRTARDVYIYVSVVIGAAIATPMQLGETLKVKFARDSGLSYGNSLVNLALERVIDLAAICAMAAGGLIHAAGFSAGFAGMAMSIPLFLGFGAPSFLHLVARRLDRRPFGQKLDGWIGASMSPRRLIVVSFCTLAKWGLTVLIWLITFSAVGVDASLWQGMLLVGVVTGISILSMVPGGIGVQEVSVRALLVSLGYDSMQAEAAAVVLRLFTPVMVALGLVHLLFLGRKAQPPHFKT